MARKSRHRSPIHAPRRRQDLTPVAPSSEPERGRRPPRRAREEEQPEREECGQHEERRARVANELDETPRACRDGGAEEVGRTGPEHAARGHGVAPRTPALRPRDRLGPLRLQVRAGRPVEEHRLELPPASLEVDPRERAPRGCRVARDGLHGRAQLVVRTSRVVATDAGLRRAAEVQRLRVLVRVRPGGRIDDRMAAADQFELVVAPVRSFGPFVRAVADGDRILRQGGACRGGIEVELDHLPVALVQVVEVVEDVEEPVLQRDHLGVRGIARYVRIHGRLRPVAGSTGSPSARSCIPG